MLHMSRKIFLKLKVPILPLILSLIIKSSISSIGINPIKTRGVKPLVGHENPISNPDSIDKDKCLVNFMIFNFYLKA